VLLFIGVLLTEESDTSSLLLLRISPSICNVFATKKEISMLEKYIFYSLISIGNVRFRERECDDLYKLTAHT